MTTASVAAVISLHRNEGQRLVLMKCFKELQQSRRWMNMISLIYLCKNPKMPFASRQCTAWLAVCAPVVCDTLAARHLTASFFSAAPSLAPLAEPWLGWQSAVCLQAAFSCLSPPGQNWKGAKLPQSLRCESLRVRRVKSMKLKLKLRQLIGNVCHVMAPSFVLLFCFFPEYTTLTI